MLLNAVSLTVTVSVLRVTESLSPKGVDVLAGDERVGGLIKKHRVCCSPLLQDLLNGPAEMLSAENLRRPFELLHSPIWSLTPPCDMTQ